MMDTGIIILADFDKTRNTMNPAIIQKMAVRVPDWNIAHVHKIPAIPKNNLYFLTLLVIVMIKKTTAAAAM